ncbi:pap 25a associated domain family protein [Mucor ambiguus]|uniref:Pap 25a associated domain family protein n=1 Tax=Mucor ambiguus TaxID=91626 RepID=A0A0C9MMS2_9FUNG|nr:pap 25a associated domain family protein [Mucor ambiguus]
MSNNPLQVSFLEVCGLYAFNHSITDDISTAKVVTIRDLKDYLNNKYPELYRTIAQIYCPLEQFLKEIGRDIVRAGLVPTWSKYNYELMTQAQYYADKRHEHDYFSELTKNGPDDTALFVLFYKEDKIRYEAERAEAKKKNKNAGQPRYDPLTDEIWEFCYKSEPTDQFFMNTKSLVKRLQNMLDTVWPGMNYRVAIFGSAANLLCLKDADVDLCIVVPEAKFESDLRRYKQKLSKQPKSVYNMYFLANRLKTIGMKNVEAIGSASVPICKFVDPQTGFSCDINTHNILGIENTRMVGQYTSLDIRIRPFLTAIKQFVKQKDLNSPLGGTLSSYAYVLMALHFLMAGLETPVIPSLQKLAKCHSKNCKSKTGRQVLLYHDHQLIRCDARYHDCVHVKNSATSEYLLEPHTGKNDTITYWESKNKDTVSQLLNKFFVYYSNPNNRAVSIITSDGKLYNQDTHRWHGQPIIVQDPFILTKNVARSCTTIGATAIFQEFSRAAMLTSGTEYTPYTVVCDNKQNLPRPLDTECMQYRFHKPKQTTTTTTLTEIRAKVVKQQQQQQPKEDQVVGYLQDIQDNEQLEHLLSPLLVDGNAAMKKDEKTPSKPAATEKDVSAAVAAAVAAAACEAKAKQEATNKVDRPSGLLKTAGTATKTTAANSTNAELIVVKAATTATTSTTVTTAKAAASTATKATSTGTAPTPAKATKTSGITSGSSSSVGSKNESTSSRHSVSQNNSQSAPILKLVQKLISYQSTPASSGMPDIGTFENLTSKPCTDMQKLLDDPCMSGVDMKDICYLIAQLNFLGDAIADRVLNPMGDSIEMKSKIQEFIEQEHMALIGQQLREMVYGEVIAATTEDDLDDGDIFGDYNSEEEEEGGDSEEEEDSVEEEEVKVEERQTEQSNKQNVQGQAVPKQEETDDDDDDYEDIDSDEDETAAQDTMIDLHAVWSEQPKQNVQRQYKENEMVDVYFYVKDVPHDIDSYEIYLQFDWYGKVIEIRPAETTNTSVTWHVQMEMLYKTYKRLLPVAVELGNSQDDVYTVTKPQLAPHWLSV